MSDAPRGEKRKWDERGGRGGGRGGRGGFGGHRGGGGGGFHRGGGRGGGGRGGGGGGNGSIGGTCFNCNKPGHRATACPDGPSTVSRRGGFNERNPNNAPLGPRGGRSWPQEPSPEEIEQLKAALKLDLTTVRPECDTITSESSVGMTAFLNPTTPPFSAMFKTKQHDFQVNEVGKDGNVSQKDTLKDPAAVLPDSPAGAAALTEILGEETIEQFLAFCTEEKKRIDEWHGLRPRPKKPAAGEFIIHKILSKSARTAIHDIVRLHYPYIISDAVNADYVPPSNSTSVVDTPYVSAATLIQDMAEAEHPNKKQKVEEAPKPTKTVGSTASAAAAATTPAALPDRKLRLRFAVLLNKVDGRVQPWPKDRPDYLRFTLYKENLGTMEALQAISTQLRLNLKLFGFAGTKDKRAITTQYVTAFKVGAEKFKHLTQAGMGSYCLVKCGDFTYVPSPLRLGDLTGNQFKLVLRNVKGISEENLETLLEEISKRGFINYYGLQRFGSSSIPTHAIGRALLRRDFGEALALILMPRVGERHDLTAAREYLARTCDIAGTLARLPHFMKLEQDVLRTLQTQGVNAFQNAIESIPRAMRLMYVHAYQSLVWNKMASARIAMNANDVIEGDMVVITKSTGVDADATPVVPESNNDATTDATPAAADATDESKDDANPVDAIEPPEVESTYKREDIHVVTAEDVASKKYALSDIVLPLPGYDVEYPTNSLGEAYASLLSHDGVIFKPYVSGPGAQLKDFCLAGNYRKVIQLPTCMKWEIKHYTGINEPLHEKTDWEKISEKKRQEQAAEVAEKRALRQAEKAAAAAAAGEETTMEVDTPPAASTDAPQAASAEPAIAGGAPVDAAPTAHLVALNLVFQLPSSTYATMLLRELMKSDTTTENQKHLALEHRREEEGKVESKVETKVEENQPQQDETKQEESPATSNTEQPAMPMEVEAAKPETTQ